MSDYTIITDFAAKDSLLPGNPAKAGKGTEITAELQAISTAIASKADSASPVLTTPQINDTSADHQYVVAVSELAADRTVTLPLLTGNDEFVFKDHAVTLTNKTVNLTSNTLSGTKAQFNTACSDGDFLFVGDVSGSDISYGNKVINGGFTINQRGYASGAVLASGSYGHDRWKAGASGGDYSFTQLASNTTITIASGKSLIQVVEDKNVDATDWVLSWTGTAQARYAVNSATPAGAYAASPVLITGQTLGTVMSIEFNNGTLGKVQLEKGTSATTFESRPYGVELALCQRYYYRITASAGAEEYSAGYVAQATEAFVHTPFPVTMRTKPTALEQTGTAGNYSVINLVTSTVCTSVPVFSNATVSGAKTQLTTGATLTAGQGCLGRFVASTAYLGWSAEL